MTSLVLNSTKKTLSTVAALTTCMLCSVAQAESDYNFVQAHILQADYADIPGFTLQGFELRAGFGLDNVFTEARYRDLRDSVGESNLDESRWNISLGYAIPLTSETRMDVRVNYGKIDIEGIAPNASLKSTPNYEGVSSYIYHTVDQNIEVYGGLEWQNLPHNADQKAYHLGAMYQFSELSLGTEYTKYSDSDAMSLFVRYEF